MNRKRVKFIPNGFAREAFNLRSKAYFDDSLMQVIEAAIGRDNYDSFVPPQSPFAGGKVEGDVMIVLHPGEKDLRKQRLTPIGKVRILG